MHTIKALCKPRDSVFKDATRDDVLNLSDFIDGKINADKFFEENFKTKGMELLFETAFKRFAGKSETGVIKLTQAMGGGKTHNMLALALLARNPDLRGKFIGSAYSDIGEISVVAFSGRESDVKFGIWGRIAEQLECKEFFADHYSPLKAPGESAWVNLLKDRRLLILLDELPPYLVNAKSKHKADPNNLLAFLYEITFRAKSLLLATATPIQVDPIEAFDLVSVLGFPPDADKVLGDNYSVWRLAPALGIKYIQGDEEKPSAEAKMWEIIRNPFPPRVDNRSFEILREQLEVSDDVSILRQNLYDKLDSKQKNRVRTLYDDDDFIKNHNPYIRAIVRRTREFLENTVNPDTGEPYLKKIDARLFGENDSDALELSGYMAQAYGIAEEFCDMLSERVKSGGFMSTLLLKRIGSTMFAGENTAKKMLAWTSAGQDRLRSIYEEFEDEGDNDNYESEAAQSDIKELAAEELDYLESLVNALKSNTDTDPKYNRIKEILMQGAEGEGAWKDKGCILFTQYFDSAAHVAERLSCDFSDIPIGLYAGGDKSGVYKSGAFKKTGKDEIKRLVKMRELMILVGTDAASEGLNLQALGTLINIDLPWNPTRLEQRKGRIQRIGQTADAIYIYNMRYKDSVEDRVHRKLSGRLQSIYAMFGQIPDILEDVWVAVAQNDEARAELAITKLPAKNPFIAKYETSIPKCGDWEKCAAVLDKRDVLRELLRAW